MGLVSDHVYPRHSHDQFGIGLIDFGGHRSWSGVGSVDAGPGDAIMVNPGEIHDGAPIGGAARGWRMLYLAPDLLVREEIADAQGSLGALPPVARDPILARLLAQLFAGVTAAEIDRLNLEQAFHRTLAHIFLRHGGGRKPALGRPPSVAKALARLDEAPQTPTSLAELAALAGVSRFQLLRGFAREVGVTPYAYLLQLRVRLAKRLLAQGHSPAQAAIDAGFADQSHLNRAFLRQFGVTPGRYRAALS